MQFENRIQLNGPPLPPLKTDDIKGKNYTSYRFWSLTGKVGKDIPLGCIHKENLYISPWGLNQRFSKTWFKTMITFPE